MLITGIVSFSQNIFKGIPSVGRQKLGCVLTLYEKISIVFEPAKKESLRKNCGKRQKVFVPPTCSSVSKTNP